MRKQNKTVSVFVSVFFFCREYDIINSRIQMYFVHLTLLLAV